MSHVSRGCRSAIQVPIAATKAGGVERRGSANLRQPRRPKGGSIRGLRGPGGIHLHSPQLALHTRALNHYLRREAGLGGRLRELAILTTARELDSQIEWTAHEPEALREGLSSEIVDVIRCRRDTARLDPADAIVIELGREIFANREVSSATFARRTGAIRSAQACRSGRADGKLRGDRGVADRI